MVKNNNQLSENASTTIEDMLGHFVVDKINNNIDDKSMALSKIIGKDDDNESLLELVTKVNSSAEKSNRILLKLQDYFGPDIDKDYTLQECIEDIDSAIGDNLSEIKRSAKSTEINDLKENIQANKESLDGKLVELTNNAESNKKALEEKLASSINKINELSNNVNANDEKLENQIDLLSKDSAKSAEINDLKENIQVNKESLDGKLVELTNNAESNKKALEEKLASSINKIDELSNNVNANDEKLENQIDLLSKDSAKSTEINDLKEYLTALNLKISKSNKIKYALISLFGMATIIIEIVDLLLK